MISAQSGKEGTGHAILVNKVVRNSRKDYIIYIYNSNPKLRYNENYPEQKHNDYILVSGDGEKIMFPANLMGWSLAAFIDAPFDLTQLNTDRCKLESGK